MVGHSETDPKTLGETRSNDWPRSGVRGGTAAEKAGGGLAARIGRPAKRQSANSILRTEPVGRKPRAHSPGSGSPINQPRNGAKDASADALGYALASFGLGSRKNRRGLRRKQGIVIENGRAATNVRCRQVPTGVSAL